MLALVGLVLEHQQPAEAILDKWIDKIQSYMEADLAPCVGEQKILNDLDFGSLSSPEDACVEACKAVGQTSKYLNHKYSGSSVLCCCSKQSKADETRN